MACYLRAVKVAPDYTPGFYRTAMLLFNSDRPELALCYGEMFLAKESENKSRIEAVSKGIVDTYRSIARVDGDTLTTHFPATNITLSTNSTAADLEREFLRFDVIYSVDFDFAAKSLGKVAALDAETICRLRTRTPICVISRQGASRAARTPTTIMWRSTATSPPSSVGWHCIR